MGTQEDQDYYYTDFDTGLTDSDQSRNVLTSSAILQLVRDTESDETDREQGRSISQNTEQNSVLDRIIEENDLQDFIEPASRTAPPSLPVTTQTPFVVYPVVYQEEIGDTEEMSETRTTVSPANTQQSFIEEHNEIQESSSEENDEVQESSSEELNETEASLTEEPTTSTSPITSVAPETTSTTSS